MKVDSTDGSDKKHLIVRMSKVRLFRRGVLFLMIPLQVLTVAILFCPSVFHHFLLYYGWLQWAESPGILAYWHKVQVGGRTWAAGSVIMAGVFAFAHYRRSRSGSKSIAGLSLEIYIFLTWSVMIGRSLMQTLFWFFSPMPAKVCGVFVCLVDLYSQYFFYTIIEERIRIIEAAWSGSLGSKPLRIVRRIWVFCTVLNILSGTFECFPGFEDGHLVCLSLGAYGDYWALTNAFDASMGIICGFTFLRAITIVRRPTIAACKQITGFAQVEMKWARDYLGFLRLAMGVPLLAVGIGFTLKSVAFHFPELFEYSMLLDGLARTNSALMEFASLFFLVDVLKQHQPEIKSAPKSNLVRTSDGISRSAEWEAKVRDLSERSMTVFQLLEFYKMLGEVMPSFDPLLSTTSDVVREAIIPLSRAGDVGVAYSESSIASKTQTGLANTMVTHAWDNLFAHLVASVVADALGKQDYEEIAQELTPEGLDGLFFELERRQCLHTNKYWICAFCVNQHAGICHSLGPRPDNLADEIIWDRKRRDSVTRQIHRVCPCSMPKYFAGDMCEMNKFDEMMALLSKAVPELRQLVAVDKEFVLFSRAWCVAELVQASMSKIPQNVAIFSDKPLSNTNEEALQLYAKLAKLTVLDCEASRKEDKEGILARIDSIPEFDAHLQELILGNHGLLRKKFVGLGLLDAAVRMARRSAAFLSNGTE